jgi:hypothetical protein
MHPFNLSIGFLSSWFAMSASLSEHPPPRVRSEKHVKLAPRSPQATLDVELSERNCNEDSECTAPGLCMEPVCHNGWCSATSRKDTPIHDTGPSCYLGQYTEVTNLPAECGAQSLEQLKLDYFTIKAFYKSSCGERTPEQCEYHRINELRKLLIDESRDIMLCITDHPTYRKWSGSKPIPWEQTPFRGVTVEGAERDSR